MTLDDIYDAFEFLDDWEERYRHLIEMGRALPALDEAEQTAANKVEGCMSQVWMVAMQDESGRFHFRADSDAHIVKGLVAILMVAYSGRTAAEIRAIDIDAVFARLGLAQHLSPNRRNGFFAMVGRIKALAAA